MNILNANEQNNVIANKYSNILYLFLKHMNFLKCWTNMQRKHCSFVNFAIRVIKSCCLINKMIINVNKTLI